ncbi:MAG: hypothetical protein ACREIT_03480 [Tepidisphaeraceae bacterium]
MVFGVLHTHGPWAPGTDTSPGDGWADRAGNVVVTLLTTVSAHLCRLLALAFPGKAILPVPQPIGVLPMVPRVKARPQVEPTASMPSRAPPVGTADDGVGRRRDADFPRRDLPDNPACLPCPATVLPMRANEAPPRRPRRPGE